jgi:type II secretory pathway pseudopilin PulG
MLPADHRRRRRRSRASGEERLLRRRLSASQSGDDGFMLIEVVITAFLVGLIVVAVFSGFSVASNTSADQRRHDQAAVLAAQSQEQLRTDPANALEVLEATPHSYMQTLGGTEYKITESSKFINDKTQASACTAPGEVSKQNGSYLQVTSVVTWKAVNSTYPKVEQSSIITPPTGSALEIDVVNGASPEEGVPGVNASVEYTGVESTQPTLVEGTTTANGCVVFGAIPATTALVNVKPPLGYVTPSDTFKIPPEPVTLAPNLTTHKEYIVNRGGAIQVEFTYKGKAEQGETFVASNGELTAPSFVVGSTSYKYESGGEERYTPLASTATTNTQATIAESPKATNYPTGNLFPWATKKYLVFAGDCLKNNVKETSNPEGLEPEPVLVEPGKTPPLVKIPLSLVTLNVYTGKIGSTTLTGEAMPVRITNTGCKTPTPNDATAPVYIHEQKLSGGHLQDPYQPYGSSFSLCVYSASKNYTVTYADEKQVGPEPNIYLGEGTVEGKQVVESTSSTVPAC